MVASDVPVYSTPRVSGGITSVITGNSPWSLPLTIRKLNTPSLAVSKVTSFTSFDQWLGLSTMGLLVTLEDLLSSFLISLLLLILLVLLMLLALYLLGVIGRLLLWRNILIALCVTSVSFMTHSQVYVLSFFVITISNITDLFIITWVLHIFNLFRLLLVGKYELDSEERENCCWWL